MFDMTKCKIGDELLTVGGKTVSIEKINLGASWPFQLSSGHNVGVDGICVRWGPDDDKYDILGFLGQPEHMMSYPNIEPRTTYVEKIVSYRIHFNELYSRDVTEEEAKAIYQQLKSLFE